MIGGWYIPSNLCDELIKLFKDNEDNQISINETLMKEGHAYSYHGETKKKYENK